MIRELILLTFISLCLPFPGLAQENGDLSIELVSERDTFYALSPWTIKVVLTNKGMKDAFYLENGSTFYSMEGGRLEIEVENSKNTSWRQTALIKSNCHSMNRIVKLPAGEYRQMTFKTHTPSTFLLAGKNQIRAAYSVTCNGGEIPVYSKPISVFIQPYQGQDSLAYIYINKNMHNPESLFFPTNLVDYDTNTVWVCKNIIEAYPTSKFATLGYISLFHFYLAEAYNKTHKTPNHEDMLESLRISKKYAQLAIESQEKYGSFTDKFNYALNYYFDVLVCAYGYNIPDNIWEEFERIDAP